MITKKVNRYYCEYCKKANCSASSISKHEKSCTLNPVRVCGMCKIFNLEQSKMSDLLTILPKPVMAEDEYGSITVINIQEIEVAMPKLREATENCPACILAVLRQMEIPVPAIRSFNFTEECKSWWADFNEAQDGKYNYY
ncbi:MAG: hypothetical protein KKE05_07050 [Nanoarchaeota archaeon]|nr:hypothetical protein [Nanoarchaeota archaeon]